MKSTDFLLVQLYEIFDQSNKRFYSGQLPRPVITVQSNKAIKSSTAMGWFTTSQVWRDSESSYYEINLSPEYLNRSVEEIFSTLLHEMAHLYCKVNDIKDTSRQGRYHNSSFKKAAEAHGLNISFDKSIGWSDSTLNLDGLQFLKTCKFDVGVFGVYRVADARPAGKPRSKPVRYQYTCPVCESVVTSKNPYLHIRCVDCDCNFELEEN